MSSTDKPISNDMTEMSFTAPTEIQKLIARVQEMPAFTPQDRHTIILLLAYLRAKSKEGTPEAVGKVKEHPAPAPSREPSDEELLDFLISLGCSLPFPGTKKGFIRYIPMTRSAIRAAMKGTS